MVKAPHEALHRIFQRDPRLFARALGKVGIAFPNPTKVSVLNTDLTGTEPIERRVDTVLLVETDVGNRVIAIESQTSPEKSKRFAWPYYVAFLYNRYECPVTLLVVTADSQTELWARQPIEVGLPEAPSQTTWPLVLGPDTVPPVMAVDVAQEDVLVTVLSALTHRLSVDVGAILKALAAALAQVDEPTAKFLAEFTEVGLGKSQAADNWRVLMRTMKYGFESQLHREWREEGREEGRAQEAAAAVLRVLKARRLAVREDVARRVQECTDRTVLEELLERAVTIEDARDLFADL